MSEIVDDLKVANVEVTSNLGLRLSGDEPEIKTTQTLAPLTVTAGGDLTLTSSAGAVNVNADGRIDLDSNDVVVGNPAGTVDIDSNTVTIGNPAGTVDIDSNTVTVGNPAGTIDLDSNTVTVGNSGGLIGFFGVSPVIRQSTMDTSAGFTQNSGTEVRETSTFNGNLGGNAYTIGDIVRALKNLGLLA